MKYSIIVPVYNVEQYIGYCIESVLIQTFTDFELILIDDGSCDNSRQICEMFAKRDARIKFFNKKNEGVSSARNLGLDYSSGEWIVFLDADDTIHPNMLELLGEHIAINDNVDLIQFAYERSAFVGNKLDIKGPSVTALPSNEYCRIVDYNVTVWASIIRASIIKNNNIRFDVRLKLAEDQVFMLQAMSHSKMCSRVPYVLYHYRNNPTSATNTYKIECLIQTTKVLEEYKRSLPIAVAQLDNVIMSYMYMMVTDLSCPKTSIVSLFEYVDIISLRRCSCRVKILYYLLSISIRGTIDMVRGLKTLYSRIKSLV